MRPIQIAWCLALTALLAGCQDQVTEPAAEADQADAPLLQVGQDYVTREFVWDTSEYVECANDGAGEDLLWDGIVVATTKKVDTPSGAAIRSTTIDAFEGLNYDEFMAFGQTSGDEWVIVPGASTWTTRRTVDTDGEFSIWHQTYSFRFVNQDGERIHVQGNRVENYDRDGELVLVEYNRGSCIHFW